MLIKLIMTCLFYNNKEKRLCIFLYISICLCAFIWNDRWLYAELNGLAGRYHMFKIILLTVFGFLLGVIMRSITFYCVRWRFSHNSKMNSVSTFYPQRDRISFWNGKNNSQYIILIFWLLSCWKNAKSVFTVTWMTMLKIWN